MSDPKTNDSGRPDSLSPDSDDYVPHGKGGLGLRTKKFFASKTAGTKIGRRLINQFLGKNGEAIVKALLSLASQQLQAKKLARRAEKNLYKIATKFKILVDEKKLTAENTAHAEAPLNELGVLILEALSLPERKADIAALRAHILKVKSICKSVFKAHVQEKNYNKLNDLFDLFGGEPVLNALLNDSKNAGLKRSLFENLSEVLTDQRRELETRRLNSRPTRCLHHGCRLVSVRREGPFMGSKYCAMHHLLMYREKLRRPKLNQFLAEGDGFGKFMTFLSANEAKIAQRHAASLGKSSPTNLFNFVRAVKAYEDLDRPLRRQRANVIVRKYCNPSNQNTFTQIDSAAQSAIRDGMDATKSKKKVSIPHSYSRRQSIAFYAPSKDLFVPATSQVMKKLAAIFETDFLQSKEYRAFLATVTLPLRLVPDAEAALKRYQAEGGGRTSGGRKRLSISASLSVSSTSKGHSPASK